MSCLVTDLCSAGGHSTVAITVSQVSLFHSCFFFSTAVDWASGMLGASGYLNILVVVPIKSHPSIIWFWTNLWCKWKVSHSSRFHLDFWLLLNETTSTLFTWKPKSLHSMHERESIMGKKKSLTFSMHLAWRELWENLDSFQSFKENTAYNDWWNLLLVVVSGMQMVTSWEPFWDECFVAF